MSIDVDLDQTPEPGTPPPSAATSSRAPRGATWRLSWHGVRTVAVLELRQRVRSTRWVIVLAVWFVAVGGLTTLIRFAVHRSMDPTSPAVGGAPVTGGLAGYGPLVTQASDRAAQAAGAMMFGIIVFLVLGLAGLVAPALTATSVNGDRQAGVLATLQTTLLSAAESAVGKLLAAWTTALALLAAATPFIGWAYVEGGTSAGRLLVTVALLAVMLLVVCAVALGWSAVTARTSTSAVLTYLSVAFLGLGLPLLFAVCVPLVTGEETVQVYQSQPSDATPPGATPTPDPNSSPSFTCRLQEQQTSRSHTERIWWLLPANPFVVLADAAPRPASDLGSTDPLTAVRDGVREARLGPAPIEDWCGGGMYTYTDPATGKEVTASVAAPPQVVAAQAQRTAQLNGLGAVWPYGLVADLALGAGFVVLAVRRLRAPARTLPSGTRVA